MKTKKSSTFLIILFFLSACNLPVSMRGGEDASSVAIISPVDGARLQLGELVDIQSSVSYEAGATSTTLKVNDAIYRVDNLANPVSAGSIYLPWTPTQAGIYTLTVTVSGADGELVSAPITVDIVEADAPASLSLTTVAAPTETLPPNMTATVTVTTIATATATEIVILPSLTTPPRTSTVTFVPPPTATATFAPLTNSSISGKVFRDENGSGSFNPADTPLVGVTVLLGKGACPSSGLAATQTTGDGSYTFTSLTAGQYCIMVDTNSLPNIGGTWQASLPNPAPVTLGDNDGGTKNFMFQPIIQ